jgi:16S rRNA (cytosine967-C5)-methyltransferase
MIVATADARSLAAQAVARILDDGVTLDAALQSALAAAPRELVPPVRSLAFGAVRGFYRHEAILGRLLSQPTKSLDTVIRALLSIALFELEDARTPQYAVVDAAVKTAKSSEAARAGGLVNAVLRRYLRERHSLEAQIASNPAVRHACPQWLAERFRADWPGRWTQLLAAGDAQAPLWLRVNRRLTTAADASSAACRRRWCSRSRAMSAICRASRRVWSRCRTSERNAPRFHWASNRA